MHRIPRTIHDGFFVRTPFPTKISTAQEKSEMRWKSSYRAFVHYIHGWCRQHALALSRRRICEKSQNAPYFNRHFRWRYLLLKAECAMIHRLSKFYMAIIIVATEWTPWRLHIVDAKKIEKWTVFKCHFRWRYRRYRKTENTMTCYSSRAFITYRFRFCALEKIPT